MPVLETTTSGWAELLAAVAAGTEPTDLSVVERTYAAVKAVIAAAGSGDEKIGIFTIDSPNSNDSRSNAMRFRCSGVTPDSVCTFVLYVGTINKTTDCDLTHLGTLSFTVGTQASIVATYKMADQVAVTAGDTIVTWGSKSAADERVAEAAIDLQGSDILVIVPTVVGSDCKLFGKAY